jgi:hypothetical protein
MKVKAWLMESELGKEIISETVHREMDTVSDLLRLRSKEDISLDYLRDWKMESYREQAPFVYMCLQEAAQSKDQRARNKHKHPNTVRSWYALLLISH